MSLVGLHAVAALHGGSSHFSIVIGAFGTSGLLDAIGLLFVGSRSDPRRLSSWFAAGHDVRRAPASSA